MRDLFGEDILGYVILLVILVLVFGTKRNSDGNINNVFSNAAGRKAIKGSDPSSASLLR
jgi:hypothetical protein